MAAVPKSFSFPPPLKLRAGARTFSALQLISVNCRFRVNSIASMELVLGSDDGDPGNKDDEVALCQPGSTLQLAVENGATIFEGLVTRAAWRTSSARSELRLQVRHPLQRLMSSYRSQVFENMSDADIVRTLLSAQGIAVAKIAGLTVRHAQMVQFRCSDWRFVVGRLIANGVWLTVQPAGVSVDVPTLAATANHTLRRAGSTTGSPSGSKGAAQTDVEEAQWSVDVMDVPNGVEVTGWDMKQQKTVTAKGALGPLGQGALDPSKLKGLGKTAWTWMTGTPFEAGELEALARARLLQLQLASIVGRFVVAGSTDFQPGQTLQLSGFGKHFDGRCIVTGVEHQMVQGIWRTAIETGVQDAWRDVDEQGVQPAAGTYVGIVEAIEGDAAGLDRFKVRVPALLQDNKPLWARFSTPFGGKTHGLYLYPSVGDEVCVTFFDDDPRYPVIGNAMFNPKTPPPYQANAKGVRALVFDADSKQQLLFDAQSGELTLQSGKNRLTLKDGVELVSDDKNLKLEAQGVSVNARQKVDVKGTSGVSIKGVKIELDQ